MAMEDPVAHIMGRGGIVNPSGGGGSNMSSSSSREGAARELGLLIGGGGSVGNSRLEGILTKRDLLPHRSGSAPPSVEGSLASMGGFFGSNSESRNNFDNEDTSDGFDVVGRERELRSDPAYFTYYYSNINLNPRLPPPIISWDTYRHLQQFAASGIGDRRKMGSYDNTASKFPLPSQSGLSTHREDSESENVEVDGVRYEDFDKQTTDDRMNKSTDGLVNLPGGFNAKPKCLVDLIQEDFPRTPSPVYNHHRSRPSSRAANEEGAETHVSGVDANTSSDSTTGNVLCAPYPDGKDPLGVAAEEQGVGGDPREEQHSGYHQRQERQRPISTTPAHMSHSDALLLAQQQQQQQQHYYSGYQMPVKHAQNMYAAAAAMSYMAPGSPFYQNLPPTAMYPAPPPPPYGLSGYPLNPSLVPTMIAAYPPGTAMPVTYDNVAAAATIAANLGGSRGMPVMGGSSGSGGGGNIDFQQLHKYAGNSMPSPLLDPTYLQYLQQHSSPGDSQAGGGYRYMRGSQNDLFDSLKSLGGGSPSFAPDKKPQLMRSSSAGVPIGTNNAGSTSPVFYSSSPGVGYVMPYPNSPISSPVLPGSPVIPGGFSLRQMERNYPPVFGVGRPTAMYGWQPQRGNVTSEEFKGLSLLDELKNSKTRRFDLLDITGHVAEFSADQQGSRFIQQKLETATDEEKAMVFQEVLPQALTLITDVFGNYVIQKFFEHGASEQRMEIANQLVGQMLNLSLQMYGCRVIQKALEVIEMEQRIKLVSELDGHVMRCVRDQNGNHVIQKCIECIPAEKIQFVISAFYGNVVVLSTHPYGCRVIQRVLEHCCDEKKEHGIMEEILSSACSLAQDQYGNYVVQHVLEHGNPQERSEIITKLAGQIVQMSQHKFASNVIEKCLEFGAPAERQLLINEILGLTDENEPLQVMMKDQFANYVVQKVLETCDDQQRELLLSRIRVHLHALKKYTYGKHIVARVEKLVVAGERCNAQAL